MRKETLGHFAILFDKESLHLQVKRVGKGAVNDSVLTAQDTEEEVVLASVPGKPFIASSVGDDDFTEGNVTSLYRSLSPSSSCFDFSS